MKVGQNFSDIDLDALPTMKLGRKNLLDEKPEWLDLMNSAKHKWVVLESVENTPTNSSRLRNRVTRINKACTERVMPYEFITRTNSEENVIAFLGKRKNFSDRRIYKIVQ